MRTVHIVGGGITGCSLAYFLKDKYNIKLYEKNSQLGGLSRTFYSIENIPYQKGFHVLHTNKQWIINTVKKSGLDIQRVFYEVAINPLIDFKYYKFPFNDESINYMPWHWREAVLQDFNKVSGSSGADLREEIVNFYGQTIYDIFYKNYIKKLTGYYAEEIDEPTWFRKQLHSIDKVVNYYPEDCYFPINQGWNKLFDYLAEGVDVIRDAAVNREDFSEDDIIVVTTRPDDFLKDGEIPYIGFEFDVDSVNYDQNKPDTIIYPNDVSFFSMTQYGKLFSPEDQVEGKNIIVKEYTFMDHHNDTAYPVPIKKYIQQHAYTTGKLKSLFKHIYFCGPLAQYKHMSMAESMEAAHVLAGEIKHGERSM